MKRTELEKILRNHLRGVHEQLEDHFRNITAQMESLLRGVETALDTHLNRTETALADAIAVESEETETRIEALEQRVTALETNK